MIYLAKQQSWLYIEVLEFLTFTQDLSSGPQRIYRSQQTGLHIYIITRLYVHLLNCRMIGVHQLCFPNMYFHEVLTDLAGSTLGMTIAGLNSATPELLRRQLDTPPACFRPRYPRLMLCDVICYQNKLKCNANHKCYFTLIIQCQSPSTAL